jgi:hypothetical protein
MLTRLTPALLAVTLLGLSAPSARATTMLPLDEPQLLSRSAVVAVAETVSVEVKRAGGRVWTEAVLRVATPVKGTSAGADLTVVVPGGALGEWVQHVEGAPELVEGEASLVFLSAMPGGRRYQFTGLEQGHLVARPDALVPGGWVVIRAAGPRAGGATLPRREPLSNVLARLARAGGR